MATPADTERNRAYAWRSAEQQALLATSTREGEATIAVPTANSNTIVHYL